MTPKVGDIVTKRAISDNGACDLHREICGEGMQLLATLLWRFSYKTFVASSTTPYLPFPRGTVGNSKVPYDSNLSQVQVYVS